MQLHSKHMDGVCVCEHLLSKNLFRGVHVVLLETLDEALIGSRGDSASVRLVLVEPEEIVTIHHPCVCVYMGMSVNVYLCLWKCM